MKFFSFITNFLESTLGVKDNDKVGKAQVKFIFTWGFLASLFTEKLATYWLIHNTINNYIVENFKFYPSLKEFFRENFSWLVHFYKFLNDDPKFNELTDSILGFIADRIGVEVIKNLNIIKFIENFDTLWSILIIIVVCYIINRHALSQYSRDKEKSIHYYALLAHMFVFYISLLKFQLYGLLYIVAIFTTSLIWFLCYRKQLQETSFWDILRCDAIYAFVVLIFSIGLAFTITIVATYFMVSKLWGPPPDKL